MRTRAQESVIAVAAALLVGCASNPYVPRGTLTPTSDAAFRSQLPALETMPTGAPLAVRSELLANGMRLVVVERPDFPVATLRYQSRSAVDSTGEEFGMAELTAKALTSAGTRMESGEELRDVGINGVRFGWASDAKGTAVTIQVGTTAFGEALRMLARTVRYPTFDELAAAQNQLLEHRAWCSEGLIELMSRLAIKYLYGTNEGSCASFMTHVHASRQEQIRAWYARHYLPETSTLVIVGAVDAHDAVARAEKYFGDWATDAPASAPASVSAAPNTVKSAHAPSYLLYSSRPITYLALVQPAVPPDAAEYFPLRAIAYLLGESFSSRAMSALRHESGLSYFVDASLVSSGQRGALMVGAVVLSDSVGAAARILHDEVHGLARRGIGERETRAAKTALLRSFELEVQDNASLASTLSGLAEHGDPNAQLTANRKAINALTPAELERVARKYLGEGDGFFLFSGKHDIHDIQLQLFSPTRIDDAL